MSKLEKKLDEKKLKLQSLAQEKAPLESELANLKRQLKNTERSQQAVKKIENEFQNKLKRAQLEGAQAAENLVKAKDQVVELEQNIAAQVCARACDTSDIGCRPRLKQSFAKASMN